jgi:hypothetical protein
VAAGALALAAVVAWTAFGDGGTSKAAPEASSSVTHAFRAAGELPPIPTGGPPSPSPPAPSQPAKNTAALDASGVRTVLTRLDKLRQQAFADRNTSLLGKVYIPGPLLRQDTALLERIVPNGCRLVGVHTTYDLVRVAARRGSRVQAAVRATLNESVLVCGATATGRASGSGPSSLHIALAPHGSSYLIAAIEP